jgi:hypothetical protein
VVAGVRRENAAQQTVATVAVPGPGAVQLRVSAVAGARFRFAMSADGRTWKPIGGEAAGGYLPWALAVRIALAVGGPPGAEGCSDWIGVKPTARP